MFTIISNQVKHGTIYRMRYSILLPAVAFVFLLSAITPQLWAEENTGDKSIDKMVEQAREDEIEEEISFADAEVYFELNNTDGDLGIHALIDGEPWKRLTIEDPRGKRMLAVRVKGRLKSQGMTELFFESAEPPFDELAPEKFFRRFPEGEYEVEGLTLDGVEMESDAEVTHLMPAPPENILVSGVPAAEDCDADPLPQVPLPVVISWDPVAESHPELGRTGEPVEVVQYQVVVEELETGHVLSVELPPEITMVELPIGFTALGEEFKFEILVREESGNQTAVESCFQLQ